MNFDLNILLSSLIAASSITFAVSIPFIIFQVSDFQNNKDKLLPEIRVFTKKFKSYIEFIYHIYTLDFWKKKDNLQAYKFALDGKNYEQIKKLEKSDNTLTLYKSFYQFQKVYHKTYDNYSSVFTFKELEDFQIKANWIWYYEDRLYDDYHSQFNNEVFTHVEKFKLSRIKKSLVRISNDYQTIEKINPSIIATISGEVEIEVINPLQDLIWKYEKPLNPIVNRLFSINIITLFFGVIIPLMILNYNYCWIDIFTFILSIVTTGITIISYVLLVFFVNKYIRDIK